MNNNNIGWFVFLLGMILYTSTEAQTADSVLWDRTKNEQTVSCQDTNILRVRLSIYYHNNGTIEHVEKVFLSGSDSADWYIQSDQLSKLPMDNFDMESGDTIWVDIVFKPDLNKPVPQRFADRSAQIVAKITNRADEAINLIGHVLNSSSLLSLYGDSLDFQNVTPGPFSQSFVLCDTNDVPFILDSIFPITPPIISITGIKPNDTIFPGAQNCIELKVLMAVLPNVDTSFALHLTFALGCESEKVVNFHLVSKMNSVETSGPPVVFSLRPNPAAGESIFLTLGNTASQSADLEVFDILGAQKYSRHIIAEAEDWQQLEIPIGNLQNGTYYARVSAGGKVVTQKFEVMR